MERSRRYRIGEVAARVGVSGDTLRYYERLGLLPRLARAPSGAREFDDEDITRLRFIRGAQATGLWRNSLRARIGLRQ